MGFQTEKETEWWLRPMWAAMPLPDGSSKLIENTRKFWAAYWYLRDHCGYTNGELSAFADQFSRAKGLPYEIGFMIGVYRLPRTKAA